MIARAERYASEALANSVRGLILLICICAAAPASAEVGAAFSIFSDARFRGYSLSEGHPVGTLDLSYDDPSGLYLAGSVTTVISSNGFRPLGLQLGGGYAKRLSSGLTADIGIIHSAYSRYSSHASANSYTEVYAGLSKGILSARIAYSPHYFERGARTLYGELNANTGLARKLRLNGHFGLLAPVDYRGQDSNSRTRYDWRVGLDREVGRLSLHLAATGGGPGREYYNGHHHSRTAIVFGATLPL